MDSQVHTGSDKAATGTGNRGHALGEPPHVKPSATDKLVGELLAAAAICCVVAYYFEPRISGGMQKVAGKVTANHGLQEKGQERAVCCLTSYFRYSY